VELRFTIDAIGLVQGGLHKRGYDTFLIDVG